MSSDTPVSELVEQHSDFVRAAASDLGISETIGEDHG
jgi:hypothetical protein